MKTRVALVALAAVLAIVLAISALPGINAYRRDGETFVLYSVGPNLVDDGGTPGKWPFGQTADDHEPGDELKCDIVWEWGG